MCLLSWNNLYSNAQNYITSSDYINMYDFFQEATSERRNEPFDWLSYGLMNVIIL